MPELPAHDEEEKEDEDAKVQRALEVFERVLNEQHRLREKEEAVSYKVSRSDERVNQKNFFLEWVSFVLMSVMRIST